jgi:drug/metabolite transporter (DMT)-like permease
MPDRRPRVERLLEWRGPASAGPHVPRRRPEGVKISAAFLVWVGVAFAAAACWGAIVVLNKKVLDYVRPIPVNFLVLVVSAVVLAAIAVPLSLAHLWPLGFSMTWAAAGYLAAGAAVTWLIAFTAYYYALRSGRVGVVGPVTSTDPLFTAVFAALIVGTTIAGLTIAGLVVAFAGVALISRWMGDEPEPHAPALEGAAGPALRAGAGTVVALSLTTAAGWGFMPVMVELAERSAGGASTTMMVLGEVFGVVLLVPLMLARRTSLFVVTPQAGDRRRVVALLLWAGVLNAFFSVLFYVLIDQIGPVLTTLIIATSPIFAILGSMVFLRERLGARLALGAAVTLTGVFLATLAHAH